MGFRKSYPVSRKKTRYAPVLYQQTGRISINIYNFAEKYHIIRFLFTALSRIFDNIYKDVIKILTNS